MFESFFQTLNPLEVHSSLEKCNVKGTVLFIGKSIKLWKILDVRSKNKDIIKNDPYMTDINSVSDFKLTFLLVMSKMFNEFEKTSKGKRERSLTTDTAKGLVHTLNGLVLLRVTADN